MPPIDETRSPLRRWSIWAAIVGWWTVEGLVTTGQYRFMSAAAGTAIGWQDALAVSLGSAWLWILPTAFAIWSSQRYALRRGALAAGLGVQLAAVVGVIIFRALAVIVLNPWIGWYAALPTSLEVLLTSFYNNVFIYLLLVGVGHAVHYARTARLQERKLEDARLHTLKAQLQPHFLFNTLHVISSFVRDEPRKAERMIARLSTMLRVSLDSGGVQEVTLGEELGLLEPYLEIQQARFEDRLSVEIDVPPDLLGARVPSLLLQPLVENAVRHGVSRRVGPGRIEIGARRDEHRLRIEVRDDGVGLAEDDVGRGGIGLSNLRARLRHLYGARQSFSLEQAPGGGVIATVVLPLAAADRDAAPHARVTG